MSYKCKFFIGSPPVLKRTKERMIFQNQIKFISELFYIVRLLSLNRLIETQDPKNTHGHIGTTLIPTGDSKNVA